MNEHVISEVECLVFTKSHNYKENYYQLFLTKVLHHYQLHPIIQC